MAEREQSRKMAARPITMSLERQLCKLDSQASSMMASEFIQSIRQWALCIDKWHNTMLRCVCLHDTELCVVNCCFICLQNVAN